MNTEQNQLEYTTQGFWDSQYPEVYQVLYPKVRETIRLFEENGQPLTPESIDVAIEQILQVMGWSEDNASAPVYSNESVPVINNFNFGRRGGRFFPPNYNRRNASDLLRILFLRDLLGGGRRCNHGYCW